MIIAAGLTKSYGETRALHGIDVTIDPGEFVAIMGPSGSGKSTLVHCLSGMDRPTSGSVELAGKDLTALTEKELAALRLTKLGFVFQEPHLLASLTMADNVALPGLLAERPRPAVTAKAHELLQLLGVADIADHATSEASGGQVQRVGIARALINEPMVIFGDEPTGALNRTTAGQILDLLSDINRRGTTLVVVTHDAAVAARADRVLVLVDGMIADDLKLGEWTAGEAADRLARLGVALAAHGV